jgi:cysteine sulfinate desulfinase/cysteine desulfurase-like protein
MTGAVGEWQTGGNTKRGLHGGVWKSVLKLQAKHLIQQQQQLQELRDSFESEVLRNIPAIEINGDPHHRLPNTTNLASERVGGETLLLLLDKKRCFVPQGQLVRQDLCILLMS